MRRKGTLPRVRIDREGGQSQEAAGADAGGGDPEAGQAGKGLRVRDGLVRIVDGEEAAARQADAVDENDGEADAGVVVAESTLLQQQRQAVGGEDQVDPAVATDTAVCDLEEELLGERATADFQLLGRHGNRGVAGFQRMQQVDDDVEPQPRLGEHQGAPDRGLGAAEADAQFSGRRIEIAVEHAEPRARRGVAAIHQVREMTGRLRVAAAAPLRAVLVVLVEHVDEHRAQRQPVPLESGRQLVHDSAQEKSRFFS